MASPRSCGLKSSRNHAPFLCASLAWFFIRGPSSVVIENADRAVATVSGLQVGQYKFRLTVTDEQKSQTSGTTIINVKQGFFKTIFLLLSSYFI